MQNVRNCRGSEVVHCLQASKVACHFCGSCQKTQDIWVRARDFIIHASRQRELHVHMGSPCSLPRGTVQRSSQYDVLVDLDVGDKRTVEI